MPLTQRSMAVVILNSFACVVSQGLDCLLRSSLVIAFKHTFQVDIQSLSTALAYSGPLFGSASHSVDQSVFIYSCAQAMLSMW